MYNSMSIRETSKYILRDGKGKVKYQKEIFEEIMSTSDNKMIFLLPRGGKTAIIDHVIRSYKVLKKNCAVLCHSDILRTQLRKNLPSYCLVDTWQSNTNGFGSYKPDVIIIDEAHRACGGIYNKIFKMYPQARRLGFSGSPVRLDALCLVKELGGKQILEAPFNTIINGPNLEWLQENKYVNYFKYYNETLINRNELDVANGEFTQSSILKTVNGKVLTQILRNKTIQEMNQVIIFCDSIKHIDSLKHAVRAHLLMSKQQMDCDKEILIAHSKHKEAKDNITKFINGQGKYLLVCDQCNEGIDFPDVRCAIILDPTNSLPKHIQKTFRVLCAKEGKEESIIFDCAGNAAALGSLYEKRDWKPVIKNKKKKTDAVKKPKITDLIERNPVYTNESEMIEMQKVEAVFIREYSKITKCVCDQIWFEDGSCIMYVNGRRKVVIAYVPRFFIENETDTFIKTSPYIFTAKDKCMAKRYMQGSLYYTKCTDKFILKKILNNILMAYVIENISIKPDYYHGYHIIPKMPDFQLNKDTGEIHLFRLRPRQSPLSGRLKDVMNTLVERNKISPIDIRRKTYTQMKETLNSLFFNRYEGS